MGLDARATRGTVGLAYALLGLGRRRFFPLFFFVFSFSAFAKLRVPGENVATWYFCSGCRRRDDADLARFVFFDPSAPCDCRPSAETSQSPSCKLSLSSELLPESSSVDKSLSVSPLPRAQSPSIVFLARFSWRVYVRDSLDPIYRDTVPVDLSRASRESVYTAVLLCTGLNGCKMRGNVTLAFSHLLIIVIVY